MLMSSDPYLVLVSEIRVGRHGTGLTSGPTSHGATGVHDSEWNNHGVVPDVGIYR